MANEGDGYKLQGLFGFGGYADVWMIKNDEGDLLAIKRMLVDENVTGICGLREINNVLAVNGHPCISLLKKLYVDNLPYKVNPVPDTDVSGNAVNWKADRIFLVFEGANFDLHNGLDKNLIKPKNIPRITCDILLGLEYLHARGIWHRDIKSPNILIMDYSDGSQGGLLCDFGFSKYCSDNDVNTPRIITKSYRPPENNDLRGNYDDRADVWSAGCVLYEMLTDKHLINYDGCCDPEDELGENDENYDRALEKSVPSKFEDRISLFKSECIVPSSDDCLDLLANMLELNPSKRYSAKQCLEHRYFKNLRSYIDETRNNYPPNPEPEARVTIKPSIYRNMISNQVFNIMRDCDDYSWYRPRILFHAVDMFDVISSHVTMSENNAELYFFVCLYGCIKHWKTMGDPSPFKELFPPEIATDEVIKFVEDFEIVMFSQILNWHFFRHTVFDVCKGLDLIHNRKDVKDLMKEYLDSNLSVDDMPVGELSKKLAENVIAKRLDRASLGEGSDEEEEEEGEEGEGSDDDGEDDDDGAGGDFQVE